MAEWVGLLDCNNFFVSCERLFRPDLKGRPVVVLSSNDGCIVARSQEVKDKNIPMGIPYFQVKDILKDIDAVTFSSHFALYRDISRRVFEVMRTELDTVQQYSIDEAFFKLSGDSREVQEQLKRLKDKVELNVGIPVSVAAASSKTQVKYASLIAKKSGGVFVLEAEEWNKRIADIPLRDVWGVGHKLAQQYKSKGLTTVLQLLALERGSVKQHFGVHGERLWLELKGIQTTSLMHKAEPQKSILSSRSFKNTSTDLSVLQDAVAYHVRHAAEDLRGMGMKTSYIQVSLAPSRHGDFLLQGGVLGQVLEPATNNTFDLLKEAALLVEAIYRPYVPYKKAGIILTSFTPESHVQESLFASPTLNHSGALMPVIDEINRRSGKETILLGTRLKNHTWSASEEIKSPAYTTNWKHLKEVRA